MLLLFFIVAVFSSVIAEFCSEEKYWGGLMDYTEQPPVGKITDPELKPSSLHFNGGAYVCYAKDDQTEEKY
uniref:Uncharacterized protein n=1 Tax=Ditylenchus dipsaci TaxID=166011 RepID=A0A915ELW9_9BILA